MKITPDKWIWHGNAGHLCIAADCQFHLCTEIGEYLVSTVGEYYPTDSDKMETIGLDRFYETMVFVWESRCHCGCGLPQIDGSELEIAGYNKPMAARNGHLKMCQKYADLDRMNTRTPEES